MTNKKRSSGKKSSRAGSMRTGEMRLTAATGLAPEAYLVAYLKEAKTFRRKRKIHPRRIIPGVPQGAESHDPNPTRPLALEMPHPPVGALALAAPLAATDQLVLVRNVRLGAVAVHDTASQVCEPSVAANGDVVFYTGNWFAAVSTDGGTTFRYVDPYSAFPDPPGMGFCCDQVVQYIRRIDTFVWLLQYTEDPSGGNLQRLAFARTADVATGNWRIFDVTPASLGLPSTRLLDFPDLAVGTNMLYLTANAFQGQNWRETIVVRLPLAGIRTGNMTAQFSISTENFNFRVAQETGRRAFWASHQDTSTLRIFSWDEKAAGPTFRDVKVASWEGGSYHSTTPDGFNWLGRADQRIVGATKAGSHLYFAWGANRGGINQRPAPYVQIAKVHATSFKVLDNINLWDPASALAYPALSTNSRRQVGVSYVLGGGGRCPSHAVGLLTGTRRDMVAVEGTRGPSGREWGDYLTVRRLQPGGRLFCATGYTLQAGGGTANATPDYVVFGRASDV